jgi:hypothetical protein
MIFMEFLIAFIFALILSAGFVLVLHRSGPRSGFFWFFLLVFLATWAGGIWLSPFGPNLWGVYWLPFLGVGLVAVLLLAAFAPRRPPRNRHDTLDMLDKIEEEKEFKKVAGISMGILFAALVVVLILAVILRYLTRY